jgi:hypothetical protein
MQWWAVATPLSSNPPRKPLRPARPDPSPHCGVLSIRLTPNFCRAQVLPPSSDVRKQCARAVYDNITRGRWLRAVCWEKKKLAVRSETVARSRELFSKATSSQHTIGFVRSLRKSSLLHSTPFTLRLDKICDNMKWRGQEIIWRGRIINSFLRK